MEISGETIVAGTDYERVHIYTRDSQGEWSDMALVNTNSFSQGFGKSLALSNDTLIIGAPNKYTIVSVNPTRYMYDIGAAYIFIRDASNSWSEPQYIVAPTANEGNLFGSAVAAYGDVLAISAKGENGSRGAVYTYLNSNACFLCNRQHITASDFSDRNFGSSIALFGDTLAIGAPNDNAPGSVYVYVLDNTGMWTEQYVIKPPLNQDNDRFGHSVAIYDDTIVIGAPLEDSGSTGVNDDEQNNYENDAGAVYVYVRNNNIWTKQAYIKASNTNASDLFGNGVAVYQDTLLVGAPGEDSGSTGINSDQSNNSDIDAGAVYIYKRDSSNIWSQIEYVKASNTDPGDEFGWNVAIDNNISVINAKNEASARSGVNVEQADNSDFGRGALYLFE